MFIIIYIILYILGKKYINFVNYLEIAHTAIYDVFFIKYLKIDYYIIDDIKLNILYLLIFLSKIAEICFFGKLILKYGKFLFIVAPLILLISLIYIDELYFYSYISMFLVFSNLIIRIIYKACKNSNINSNSSFFLIFLTCIRRFETSYCCLFYQNDMIVKQKNKNVMVFTYFLILAQSLIILYQDNKNLIHYYIHYLLNLLKKKKKINSNLSMNVNSFDYFKTAPPPNTMCPICYSDILPTETSMVTPCNHAFHEYCLRKSMQIQLICPMCRQNLPEFQYKERFT